MADVHDVTVKERKHFWRVSLGRISVLVWKRPPVKIECDPRMSVAFAPTEIDDMITCLRVANDIAARIA